ncbi:MAG: hypothetical protein HFJ60_05625 [Clostridia bacterium]|jgi:hypothetical protein|nr:hypothetical protein [Clostridia bacterium]
MTEKRKRIAKQIVGGVGYCAVVLKSQSVIKKKITKKPNCDIAVQLSNAFWGICYILYNYYVVGEEK